MFQTGAHRVDAQIQLSAIIFLFGLELDPGTFVSDEDVVRPPLKSNVKPKIRQLPMNSSLELTARLWVY
jgi:hypothetical protein